MSKRRRGRADLVTTELALRDFELWSDDSGGTASVFGAELRELFVRLAHSNGFDVGDLLGNMSIPAGKPLPCCIIQRLPDDCSSIFDGSGYILAKLGRGKTVRGHSFLRDGSSEVADASYCGVAPSACNDDVSSPPRKLSRRSRMPGWLADHSMSPGTPESGEEGRSQPLLVRLHRAAALAASATPETHSTQLVRHICGQKRCGVVAHFRFGTQGDNERDEEYHKTHPGCSRQSLPCVQ